MHGKGTMDWKGSRKYNGQFLQDKRTGFGTLEWSDGTSYTGWWTNNK